MYLDGTLKEEKAEADHETPGVVTSKQSLERVVGPGTNLKPLLETEMDGETLSVAYIPGRDDRLKSSKSSLFPEREIIFWAISPIKFKSSGA